jgi:hypothetical protein
LRDVAGDAGEQRTRQRAFLDNLASDLSVLQLNIDGDIQCGKKQHADGCG